MNHDVNGRLCKDNYILGSNVSHSTLGPFSYVYSVKV